MPLPDLRRLLLMALTALGTLGAIQGVNVVRDHLGTGEFTPHAEFHSVLSGLYMLALTAVVLLLAWGPLRRGDRGFQPALVVALLALPGAVLLAVAIVPAGAPPSPFVLIAAGGLAAGLALGLLVWRLKPRQQP